jgi:hypothetical protein
MGSFFGLEGVMGRTVREKVVPVSALVAAVVGVTVGITKALSATHDPQPSVELVQLKADVRAVEGRVSDLRERVDKGDQRWERVLDDLGRIKERLGIVESKTPARP